MCVSLCCCSNKQTSRSLTPFCNWDESSKIKGRQSQTSCKPFLLFCLFTLRRERNHTSTKFSFGIRCPNNTHTHTLLVMDFHTKRFSFPKTNDEAHDCQTRQTQLEDGTIQSPRNRFSVDFSSRTRSRHYFAASYFFPHHLSGGRGARTSRLMTDRANELLLTHIPGMCVLFFSYFIVLHVSRS